MSKIYEALRGQKPSAVRAQESRAGWGPKAEGPPRHGLACRPSPDAPRAVVSHGTTE